MRFERTGRIVLAAGLAVSVFVGGAGAVLALTCAGVEARVNLRTASLQTAVLAAITARTTALVAQEQLERQRLLSSLHVMTKQISTSGEQQMIADQAASEALAQSIVEQSVADQMRVAVAEYGNTGFNACGIVQQGYIVADMADSYRTSRARVGDVVEARYGIRSPAEFETAVAEWARLAQEGDDLTADALWDDNDDRARDYISLVLGPPRGVISAGSGDVARGIDRVQALQTLARQSIAATVMADVAASNRLDAALRDMAGQWTGRENAAAWAARQAASGEKASLLDTVRIEAANVAMAANALKRDYMEEFALAGFALTYVDRMQRESR